MELVLHIRCDQSLLEKFLKCHHLLSITSLESLRVVQYKAWVFIRLEGLIDVMFPVPVMILLGHVAPEDPVEKC